MTDFTTRNFEDNPINFQTTFSAECAKEYWNAMDYLNERGVIKRLNGKELSLIGRIEFYKLYPPIY